MPRALDHLVIAFRDLAAAAERYRALGFQVGPRNRHPWGTENHIVQFDGVFLELLGLGEAFAAPAPDDPVAPFAGFLAEFLKTREGLSMMVLRSSDAEADRQAFARAHIGVRPRFDFARKGVREGREVEVAFSLAFAETPAFAQAGFFVCEQKFPQNFWSPAAQVHPNGATGVSELTLTHPDPEQVRGFLTAYLDAPAEPTADGLRFPLSGADLLCLKSDAKPGFAQMRIAGTDLVL